MSDVTAPLVALEVAERNSLIEQIMATESIVNPKLKAFALSRLSAMAIEQLKDIAAGRVPLGYPQGMVAKALADPK